MHSSIFLFVSVMGAGVLAAPRPYLPSLNLIPNLPGPFASACDLSRANQPAATTPLPAPPAGLTLALVAIGHGTQNYTCADSTNSTIPASIGAVATLYNASCIAASYPTVLALLPQMAVSTSNLPMWTTLDIVGQHFFINSTTPTFSIPSLGFTHAKKNATAPAPTATPAAVAWLQLTPEQDASSLGNFGDVYRLNTYAGAPPATCLNMPAEFDVPYAAEYWIYTSS